MSARFCTFGRKEEGTLEMNDDGETRQEEENTNSNLTLNPNTIL